MCLSSFLCYYLSTVFSSFLCNYFTSVFYSSVFDLRCSNYLSGSSLEFFSVPTSSVSGFTLHLKLPHTTNTAATFSFTASVSNYILLAFLLNLHFVSEGFKVSSQFLSLSCFPSSTHIADGFSCVLFAVLAALQRLYAPLRRLLPADIVQVFCFLRKVLEMSGHLRDSVFLNANLSLCRSVFSASHLFRRHFFSFTLKEQGAMKSFQFLWCLILKTLNVMEWDFDVLLDVGPITSAWVIKQEKRIGGWKRLGLDGFAWGRTCGTRTSG